MKHFFIADDVEYNDLGDGIKRKIIGHTEGLMACEVKFEKGAIGTAHIHDIHDQIGYVQSGKFEAEVDGKKVILKAGDAFIAPKDLLHGAVCLEAGTLIDMFNPRRDDFL